MQRINRGDVTLGSGQVVMVGGSSATPAVPRNVTTTGNGAFLLGEGPGVSVIEGAINVQKNNAVIRGAPTEGTLTLTGKDTNNLRLIQSVSMAT